MTLRIDVAKQFSPAVFGRDYDKGRKNAVRFRREWLVPMLKEAIETDQILEVNLSNVLGTGGSFAEEAFAGLITHEGFQLGQIKKHLAILCEEDASIVKEVWIEIDEAGAKDKAAKGTSRHESAAA